MTSRTCLALLATTLLATPAAARDKTLYLGVELGAAWGSDSDVDAEGILLDDELVDVDNFLEIDHKMGYDAGLIFGYDAGIIRAELDLSYRNVSQDEISTIVFVGDTPRTAALPGRSWPERAMP
jgi:OmpA-OmpF porin, OOP family